ncbi:hypothetical protein VTN02DRAFT_1194 [Thermoascus thermophilus]
MPVALVRKITTAIVVVRTLAGGVEGKHVDWGLVANVFPDYDPKFIQERGKAIMNRNRLQMAKMQSDFQERFAEAYEHDQVPRIDYGHLEAYDWEGVVTWASSELEVPTTQQLPDLPATREQFDSLFEMRAEALPTLDEIYQHNPPLTVARKRAMYASVPFAVVLDDDDAKQKEKVSVPSPRKQALARLETAKTWVRANVLTPEETYNAADARRALERVGEDLIGHAVQSLVTDRVIGMGNRGRITPGRNYDITEPFLATIGRRRPIESTQLKRAARFKTELLDADLRHGGVHEVRYNAEDGDLLALLNLAAQGRVVLVPRDPPSNKYGLTDGGYLTRLMDKGKLRFAVDVRAVPDAYVFGNPIREKLAAVPPPRGDMDVDVGLPTTTDGPFPGRIPLWFDIHGRFIKVLWDRVVAAVVGCVATRPGISAAGIASMVRPAVGAWEVELLLGWMAEVGVVRRRGEPPCLEEVDVEAEAEQPGWEVQEWWWMVLG